MGAWNVLSQTVVASTSFFFFKKILSCLRIFSHSSTESGLSALWLWFLGRGWLGVGS